MEKRTTVIVSALLACLAAGPGRASASGYEFDGVGARAVARGGAVTADCPDWTAIYWNPAGLAAAGERHMGVEARGGMMYPKDGDSFNVPHPLSPGTITHPFDKTHASSAFIFGSAGLVMPLRDGSAIGAGLYTPLLQGADFSDTAPGDPVATSLDYKSSVVAAVGNVSYARKLTERLSAGLGVNALYGSLKSESEIIWGSGTGPLAGPQRSKSDASGYGVEVAGGLTYAFNANWRFGLTARSGARILMKGEEETTTVLGSAKSDFDYPVKHPATTAVGAAWLAAPGLTLTFDCAQTWWKGFSSKLTYDTPSALLADKPNIYNWENSVKFRLGALKEMSDKYDVMAGYAFDTHAIDKDSVDFATAIDAPMHRFSGAVTRKGRTLDGTLAALVGGGRRTSGGVKYSLWGWYLMGEGRYRF